MIVGQIIFEPGNEFVCSQDFGYRGNIPHGILFDVVTGRLYDGWRLVAPGYGLPGQYGNGVIHVTDPDALCYIREHMAPVASRDNTDASSRPDGGDPAFLALLDDMRALHIAKSRGYAGQNADTWANFREAQGFGVSPLDGVLVRMSDKYIRVKSLRSNPKNDMVGESIKDTLMDLAAYALIALCLVKEKEQGQ